MVHHAHVRQILRLFVLWEGGDRPGFLHETSVLHLSFMPSIITYCMDTLALPSDARLQEDFHQTLLDQCLGRLFNMCENEPF